MLFLGSVGVVFLLLARPIVGLFTQDQAVAAYAVSCLRVVSLGLGATGVFVAPAVAYSMLAVVSAVLFKKGKWKTTRTPRTMGRTSGLR